MDVSGFDDLAGSLNDAASAIQPALEDAMGAAMDDFAAYIQGNDLSGQVLNARSGQLRNSIRADLSGSETTVSGRISANTPYAAIQEYGGVIELTPRYQRSRRLRKPDAGRIVEPERSYLRQALMDKADEISAALTVAVMEVLT